MHFAILTCEGFNELDSLISFGVLKQLMARSLISEQLMHRCYELQPPDIVLIKHDSCHSVWSAGCLELRCVIQVYA
ncbi:hypothetical protein D3C75_467510 [compost metagenome]|jgi:hypothetical protein